MREIRSGWWLVAAFLLWLLVSLWLLTRSGYAMFTAPSKLAKTFNESA